MVWWVELKKGKFALMKVIVYITLVIETFAIQLSYNQDKVIVGYLKGILLGAAA